MTKPRSLNILLSTASAAIQIALDTDDKAARNDLLRKADAVLMDAQDAIVEMDHGLDALKKAIR